MDLDLRHLSALRDLSGQRMANALGVYFNAELAVALREEKVRLENPA